MISIKVWHYIDISADFDPGKPVSTRKLAAEYGAETGRWWVQVGGVIEPARRSKPQEMLSS